MEKDIDKINESALEKVSLAQPILDKLEVNPSLANFHDPVLSKMGESRWNGHFVEDTLSDIKNMYGVGGYDEIIKAKNIPQEVKSFVSATLLYKFGVKQ
jgi:hypothetical protein